MSYHVPFYRLSVLFLAGICCNPLYGAPLLTVDQNPLTAVYGLPLPQDARLAQPGTWDFITSINLSNTLNIDQSPNDLLFVDGETHRFNMILDRGLSKHWSLRLVLPWIGHSAGFLDGPIDRYHWMLGLPEGERPTQPKDRMLLSYRQAGSQLLLIDTAHSGTGDLQLILNRQLHRSEQSAYSLGVGVKAASGDSSKLTGSGASDLSIWTGAWRQIATDVDGSASIGLLLPGKGKILRHLQTDAVAFGHAGLQWQAWRQAALKLQLDWHTRFYEDVYSAFLSDALQLSFGGTWSPAPDMALDFGIAEDIKVDASPDVNFNISLRLSYE
jgi:hypothetical protein